MNSFVSKGPGLFGRGPSIAYDDVGEGPPVVLIHGFASNREANWRFPSWYDALARAGFRVLALDVRGHGASDKPHDASAYDEGLLARDVANLMAHVGVKRAPVIGYSMGSFIAIRLMVDSPRLVERAVLAGIGENYFAPVTVDPDAVADAMLAPNADAVADPVARGFRNFAERQKNDLKAMAACFRRPRKAFGPADLKRIQTPVLVICGEMDTVTGSGSSLAAAFGQGGLVTIPGKDHMSAVGDKNTKAAAIAFLQG